MSNNDFTERLKQSRHVDKAPGNKSARETFAQTRPVKEPVHRTTINLPASVYEQLRQEAFETGESMATQLVNAWKAQRGL